jgi:hypothetical protein
MLEPMLQRAFNIASTRTDYGTKGQLYSIILIYRQQQTENLEPRTSLSISETPDKDKQKPYPISNLDR